MAESRVLSHLADIWLSDSTARFAVLVSKRYSRFASQSLGNRFYKNEKLILEGRSRCPIQP